MNRVLLLSLICLSLLTSIFNFTTLRKQTVYLTVKATTLQQINKDTEGNHINWCRSDTFEANNTAIVVGSQKEKVHFFSDKDNCPKLNDPNCQQKSYLIAGDEVITGKTYNNFTCGRYKDTIGWLSSDKLKLNEVDHNPALEKWLGNWVLWSGNADFLSGSIKIQKTPNGKLKAVGEMVYKGNIGSFEGTAKPKGDGLVIKDGEDDFVCEVSMSLLGNFLLVEDNSKCGGLNVSFGYLQPLVKEKYAFNNMGKTKK